MILAFWVTGFTCAIAQNRPQALFINDIKIAHINAEVEVSFTLLTGKKTVKGDHSLIVCPFLSNSADSTALPQLVVHGKRSRLAEERHLLSIGKKKKRYLYETENGQKIAYKASVSYQDWMQGASLRLHGIETGCCSVEEVVIGTIAENLLFEPIEERAIIKVEKAPLPLKKTTTADRLSTRFPFLAPIDSLKHIQDANNDADYFIKNNRESSLIIYFSQGEKNIERDYKNNHNTLLQLASVIQSIQTSGDCRIVKVVIAGFASPEGSRPFNEQLAWDRGVALGRFLTEQVSLSQKQIQIYNGSVDWTGLHTLVTSSNLYDKYQILAIIDTPSWEQDNRLKQITALNGGDSYRYMLKHFFPLLRNAAYVKVYYENFNSQ